MQIHGMPSPFGLEQHGLERAARVFWNLKPAQLVEEIIQRKEGQLSDKGEVFIFTGKYTGRNPDAKYIVENSATENMPVCWESNKRMSPATFAHLRDRFSEHLVGKDLFIQDLAVGADSDFKYSLRVISETAWGALFASNLFIRPPLIKANLSAPEITVIHCPDFQATPAIDGTNSEVVIALDFSNNLILIGGTGYAGNLRSQFSQ